MNQFQSELNRFFDGLTMDSDRDGAHSFRSFLRAAVADFSAQPGEASALAVYRMFFDCYRIKLRGKASFIDLLDTLKRYEENAATLLDKQRDHYIHSVNVFLLGLAVYASNPRYRGCFAAAGYEAQPYPGRHTTADEEFLFQWGVAALFHDIGYPVEITSGQMKKFIGMVADVDGKGDAGPYVGYQHFEVLNHIADVLYREDFVRPFKTRTGLSAETLDPTRPLDLLAWDLSSSFGLELAAVKAALYDFLPSMQKNGFVDHGFYSALILLKWYGYLAQRSGAGPELVFVPICKAAGAILLHNYYKNALQTPPFSLGLLEPEQHPLAFLLILCDELQEWNRTAYGILDRQRILAADCRVDLSEEQMCIHYITGEGTLAPDFGVKKQEMFARLLDITSIFPAGIQVTCTTTEEHYVAAICHRDGGLVPRPLLENLEQMARIIHTRYNAEQRNKHPDTPLAYPDWEQLPDTLKYSNLRQARAVFDKLTACGYTVDELGRPGQIDAFTDGQIEDLARDEHDSWCRERLSTGWTLGLVKDADKKTTPYLCPYDDLTEEVKDLDRDAVRNVFPLLRSIGLGAYPVCGGDREEL